MDVPTVTLFLALLAVGAQAAVAGDLVLRVGPSDLRARAVEHLQPSALRLALVVAVVASVGSLWLQYGAGFPPCNLCWFQRIAVYPLVPLLAVAVARDDGHRVRPYAVALPALGLPISLYHAVLERFPSLETDVCALDNPCTTIWVERLGYLTIPVMAASAQALILLLLLCAPKES